MLSVSTDSAGWTVVSPAADTKVIYASSTSGNDANDGLDPARPVKSLARGQALVRDGSGDWLLLKRGDVFGSFGEWKKSGRSQQEPLYIGAYGAGAERPRVQSGASAGFITYSNGTRRINNLVLTGVSFFADSYDHYNGDGTTAGIRLTCPGQQVLIEDVLVRGYKDNIVIDPVGAALTDVTVRRSVIVDAHAASTVGNGHSQGVYVGPYGSGVVIEENVLDHNGWRHGVDADRTFYSHNIYTQTGSQVTVRGNVLSRASFYGVKLNGAGTVAGNFFLRNSESVYLESAATVSDNVITEALDMPSATWGVGINTQKSPEATIRNNLITKVLSTAAAGVAGIQLYNNGTPFRGTIENNVVYAWRNGLLNNTPGAGTGSVVIRNNQFQMTNGETAAADHRTSAAVANFVYSGNTYAAGSRTSSANRFAGSFQSLSNWSNKTGETAAAYQQVGYPDPTRDAARYAQTVGAGSTADALIDAARNRSRSNWPSNLTASAINKWFWAGFRTGSPAPGVSVTAMTPDLAGSAPAVRVAFDADVTGSVAASDLIVQNQSTGQAVVPQSAAFDAASRVATFALPASLPDGQYAATVRAGSVQTLAGAALEADASVAFHFFAGDANLDRTVNLGDFAAMATNFNKAATFANGDFDYSGGVGLSDFAILASRYNLSLSDFVSGGGGAATAAPATQPAAAPAEPTSSGPDGAGHAQGVVDEVEPVATAAAGNPAAAPDLEVAGAAGTVDAADSVDPTRAASLFSNRSI